MKPQRCTRSFDTLKLTRHDMSTSWTFFLFKHMHIQYSYHTLTINTDLSWAFLRLRGVSEIYDILIFSNNSSATRTKRRQTTCERTVCKPSLGNMEEHIRWCYQKSFYSQYCEKGSPSWTYVRSFHRIRLATYIFIVGFYGPCTCGTHMSILTHTSNRMHPFSQIFHRAAIKFVLLLRWANCKAPFFRMFL